MIVPNILFQLCVFAITVSAFYPYYPEYKCIQDGACLGLSKRDAAGNVLGEATDEGVFKVKIKQRLASDDLPHEIRIARYVDRLLHKFSSRANAQAQASNGITNRANSFLEVNSAQPTLPNSAAIDQDGTDFSYMATLHFGSKKKPMHMLIDTGAASTWLMGSSCPSEACKRHDTFGTADSATYNASTETFQLNYGTGNVTGNWVDDTVGFAGFSLPFSFGVANEVSADFNNYPMDGILGLARMPGAEHPGFPQMLLNKKLLASNIFGISLHRGSDKTNDGEITFGAVDTTKFTGPITYTNILNPGSIWSIPVGEAGFNGKGAGLANRTAIIDTGTSYCFMPPADAALFYAQFPGAQISSDGYSYSVPCTTTTPAQFTFSGVTYEVPAKDWVGGKSNGTMCTSNIYSRDASGIKSWLLGDTFLKSVYSVFDMDLDRVGFAVRNIPIVSTASSSSTVLNGGSAFFSSDQIQFPGRFSTDFLEPTPVTTSESLSIDGPELSKKPVSSVIAIPTLLSNMLSPTDHSFISATSTTISPASSTNALPGAQGFNAFVASSSSVPTTAPQTDPKASAAAVAEVPATTTSANSSASSSFSTTFTIYVATFIAGIFMAW